MDMDLPDIIIYGLYCVFPPRGFWITSPAWILFQEVCFKKKIKEVVIGILPEGSMRSAVTHAVETLGYSANQPLIMTNMAIF